jgi:hypothetical protein
MLYPAKTADSSTPVMLADTNPSTSSGCAEFTCQAAPLHRSVGVSRVPEPPKRTHSPRPSSGTGCTSFATAAACRKSTK